MKESKLITNFRFNSTKLDHLLGLDLCYGALILSSGEQTNIGKLFYTDFDLLNGSI